MIYKLKSLWNHFTSLRKKEFLTLIFLMIFTSLAEMINIGIVIPLMTLLNDGALVNHNKFFNFFSYGLSNLNEHEKSIIILSFFCCIVVLTVLMRVLLLWYSNEVSYRVGSDISYKIYKNVLEQDYSEHIKRGSNEVISVVTQKVNMVVSGVISAALTVITSVFIGLSLAVVLLMINFKVTLTVFSICLALYLLNVFFIKKILFNLSALISSESTSVIKTLQDGLGSIRDIVIDGTQDIYADIFKCSDFSLRKSQGRSIFFAQSPKYIIEGVGTLLLITYIFYGYYLHQPISEQLPLLGVLILSAQKLLPQMQLFFSAISNIKSSVVPLDEVLLMLNIETSIIQSTGKLEFGENIKFRNVYFSYDNSSNLVLDNVSLSINKGDVVGIVGKSGTGKSTFADIIMGLQLPGKGKLSIDGVVVTKPLLQMWRRQIAHVPQSIYLSNSTIKENIAFGVDQNDVDEDLIYSVLDMVQLSSFVDALPNKIETSVGERGVGLSGGQRQRVGIARALYKKSSVLVLDEATSALDSEMGFSIIQSIKTHTKDLTIILITHQESLLSICDKVFEVRNKKINQLKRGR
jgi:ABC-type multidrug transport system fused ATPase/permease subunit